jgi:peroxiredoxin
MNRIARLAQGFAVALLVVSCTAQEKSKTENQTPAQMAQASKKSMAAPAFTLQDATGKSVALADYQGKVVILDFWATWCGPCRREIPHFIELQNELGSRGLQVVGVSVDQDGWAAVKPFVESSAINYPVLMYTESVYDTYQQLLPMAERGGIPFTFVIDRQGNVRERFVGYRDKGFLEAAIKPLL